MALAGGRRVRSTGKGAATVVALPSVEVAPSLCFGTVARWDEQGCLVNLSGAACNEPVPARVAAAVSPRRASSWVGREVVLLVDPTRSALPVVLGVLQPLACEAVEEPVQVVVDGQRIELEARDELVLRCGRASVTLRRNGRVVVRGAYVETCSEGINRVKGGSVKIN